MGDYQAVEALWLQLNRHHVEVEPELIKQVDVYMCRPEYQRVMDDPAQEILLLVEGARIAGAAWLVERSHEGGQALEMPVAFIQEFCIQDDRRGHGLGGELMGAVEQWARNRGLARVEFNVWANNASGVSFYEGLGFAYARHEMYKVVE